jgi:hypothetical protein
MADIEIKKVQPAAPLDASRAAGRRKRPARTVAQLRRFRFVTTNVARDRVIAITDDPAVARELGGTRYERASHPHPRGRFHGQCSCYLAGVEWDRTFGVRYVPAALRVMAERGQLNGRGG